MNSSNTKNPSMLWPFIASVIIHSIVLLKTSQTPKKTLKFFHSDTNKIKLKLETIGDDASKNRFAIFTKDSKKVIKKNYKQPKKTNKKQGSSGALKPLSFNSLSPDGLQDIPNQNLQGLSTSANLLIPKGIPEDQVTEFKSKLYSFYLRINRQFVSTTISKYFEFERLKPNWQIPIDYNTDSVILKATYDLNGNVKRIKTLKPANRAIYSKFFLAAIEEIQKIPNPPEILLNERGDFEISYTLKLN